MGVKVQGKVIPATFLKIEKRETLVGTKERREREGQMEELVSDQNTQKQERVREEEAKEMSGEEGLPEERWKSVGPVCQGC